ncbi:hypothetical protein J4T99_gp114 [Mycobacterium phage Bromden]|uniref:Uncharacterized protein n=1 Tax=Mycobacterium phage Bromden TaxID=2283252 RepID=A0A345MBP7_9CAUD|nr:hypothetical protein J4T99_gp114 [Mycobacterium phage Bromden]AXH67918.1 hypothetical protein SEA_BROMDEN_126 [Mycobacterium phage Bromden]
MGGRGGGGGGPASSRSGMVRLYHRTRDWEDAKAIVEGGFSPTYTKGNKATADDWYKESQGQYGFFTKRVSGQDGYGRHVVAVDVPKSAVERDPWSGHVRVKTEHLKGAQFRHHAGMDHEYYEAKRRKKKK